MAETDFDSVSQMSEFPEEFLTPRTLRTGEVVEGEIVRQDDEGLVVSVGLKMEGIVPSQEMRSLTPEEREALFPGATVLVTVLRGRAPGDMALLSLDQARQERAWQELQEHLEQQTTITARITASNRGGVVADWRGLRGFVPFSQLAPLPAEGRDEALAARIGQETPFHVLEVDRSKERAIFSERALWRKDREQAKERFIETLEEGALVTGKVTTIRGFGAFVNIGEADGLIPFSELSWSAIKSPEDAVAVGQEVQAQVIRVDREAGKVTLSLKRTQPEPWETVPERYNPGEVVEGTVTRIADFGAFVKLEEWVEGLVHISELSPRHVTNPRECVYEGQKVRVQILGIDTAKRRISLSYKKAFGL